MINFYYDRIIDGVTVPNGIPENFVKYYNPFFNYPLFREEVGFEPAVYPSDIRQHGLTEVSVDSIDKNEKEFLGYYTIEGFGSARNAMGVNVQTKGKYESVFKYIKKDTISLLRDVITSYASANPGSSAGLTATATALENYFKEENEKFILSKKVNTE